MSPRRRQCAGRPSHTGRPRAGRGHSGATAEVSFLRSGGMTGGLGTDAHTHVCVRVHAGAQFSGLTPLAEPPGWNEAPAAGGVGVWSWERCGELRGSDTSSRPQATRVQPLPTGGPDNSRASLPSPVSPRTRDRMKGRHHFDRLGPCHGFLMHPARYSTRPRAAMAQGEGLAREATGNRRWLLI